jgi:putative transposase
MPYWQLFYHMVWATKNRDPLLTPDVEPVIYGFLRGKATGLGATIYALNGMADHVHMVASIPPKIAVATFIGQVKAVATTRFNKSGLSETPIYWQAEYAVFSFDGKRLTNYIAYVERQKEHHAQGNTIPILERTGDGGPQVLRETMIDYGVDQDDWRREMAALWSAG